MPASLAVRRALMKRSALLCVISAALTLSALAVTGVFATQADARVFATDDELVLLELDSFSTPVDGSLAATVTVTIDRPTGYLEARLQLREAGGRLIYQKTEVRSNIETGTVEITYARDLADLGLNAGSYPIKLRVRSDSGTVREWVIEGHLLVYDENTPRVPVVLMSRIDSPPAFDSEGRSIVDITSLSAARGNAEQLARLVLNDAGVRVSLAISPVLLEEWLKASRGYEFPRGDEVVRIPADASEARLYAETLDLLKGAHGTGRLELLNVPYAAPDIGALQATGRLDDLNEHYRRSASGYLAALETTPVAGTAVSGDALPAAALGILQEQNLGFSVIGPGGVVASEAHQPSGVYRAGTLAVLLTETESSEAITAGDVSPVLRALITRAVSTEATTPYILSLDLASGEATGADVIRETIAGLRGVPWVELINASQAAVHSPAPSITLTANVQPEPGAPSGYWQAVTEARKYSSALLKAAGLDDPQVNLINDTSLIAQSGSWAGPDNTWTAADRGRDFADTAFQAASAILRSVSISAPSDLTLSSATGDVPVSVTNASGRELELTVRARADSMQVTAPEQVVRFGPQENFVTVPVNLHAVFSGDLHVEVWAGDVRLAERVTTVRASYLDRLAIVGGVAMVLVLMLVLIRRRIQASLQAATITEQNSRHDRR